MPGRDSSIPGLANPAVQVGRHSGSPIRPAGQNNTVAWATQAIQDNDDQEDAAPAVQDATLAVHVIIKRIFSGHASGRHSSSPWDDQADATLAVQDPNWGMLIMRTSQLSIYFVSTINVKCSGFSYFCSKYRKPEHLICTTHLRLISASGSLR